VSLHRFKVDAWQYAASEEPAFLPKGVVHIISHGGMLEGGATSARLLRLISVVYSLMALELLNCLGKR